MRRSTCERALLAQMHDKLASTVDDLVEAYYADLVLRDAPGEVLTRISCIEVDRLKRRHAEHLLAVLEPDEEPEQAFLRGRELGRVHALVGLEIEWYASAIATHHESISEVVSTLPDPADQVWLHSMVSRRLMQELQAALVGHRDVDASQQSAMLRLNEAVAGAGTVPDLVQGVLDACTEVDGIVAGFFGRPDVRDIFQFEIGVGEGAEEFMAEVGRAPLAISVLEDAASGDGPSGRSWRGRTIERSDSYLTDPRTTPWHEVGLRLGWRSSVSVPICDVQGDPRALLSLYADHPGFFATPARQAMLHQVKHLVERSLNSLEARGTVASGVRAHSARSRYLARLRAGDVEMIYQPIVELRTGRFIRAEALARLRGDHRLVLPAEFLPAFGDAELVELFEVGLDQALETLKTWEAQGLSVGVALNLPALSSSHERYAAIVERALGQHRVTPSRLTLEMLETGYVGGRPRWQGRLFDQFKGLGVRLAQDDLGSGHSSLLRLRHFAFDDVKLDQSLIRGHEFDPRGALNFIQPLTSLVHSMGLNVVVEGLENRGLVEAALMLGGDAGQGYGISRPLSARTVPAWAEEFHLDLDPERPSTHLGALAAHVAWEHRAAAAGAGRSGVPAYGDAMECPLTRYISRIDDPGDHLAEAHAEVHRAAPRRGSTEHMRWWRVLTKMLAGLDA